ncbi:MAG: ATP-binding response regulator [Actinomycetota bacterium]
MNRGAGMEERPSFAEARILVVDDEPPNVALLEQALSRAGYANVCGLTDSREVPNALKTFQPDLLLLDLYMPHVDGFGVLSTLTEIIPSTTFLPILVLTADVTPETKRRVLAQGATDFLTKPFDLTEVLLRIRNMLHTRELHLELQGHNRELEKRVRERTAQLERALGTEREAAMRLRQLDEMKSSLLTAVSHEVRTPLTSILAGAGTLEQLHSVLGPDEQRDLIHRLVVNAKRLNRILSDLLDVDRLARGVAEPTRRPTDLGALIERIVTETALPNDHPVHVRCETVTAEIDAPMVERMVENLVVNAGRHTPPGTPIWVNAHAEGDGVLIVVEDSGPGIAQELRSVIFEPFRQGGDRIEHAPGVGIGLSLVRRFAELHGGRAWVEDRPDGGASFRVFLPAATATVPQ